MKDIERRKTLLENGTYKNYIRKRKELFNNGVVFVDDNGQMDISLFDLSRNDLIICERIRKCYKEQREKVENHIMYLFTKSNYDLYFITFTFTNKALNETKAETRKQNIRRLLSRIDDYILNIDYGKQTDREHYHSIVAVKKGTYQTRSQNGHIKLSFLDNYRMGSYDVQMIRKTDKDKKRLSRYIAKLTMHSVKVKQKYISVKKGSEYQISRKITKKVKERSRSENRRYFADEKIYDELMANEL